MKYVVSARGAESTFITADAGVGRVRRQVAIAAFAVRAKF
jgi:hypothetical protein